MCIPKTIYNFFPRSFCLTQISWEVIGYLDLKELCCDGKIIIKEIGFSDVPKCQ